MRAALIALTLVVSMGCAEEVIQTSEPKKKPSASASGKGSSAASAKASAQAEDRVTPTTKFRLVEEEVVIDVSGRKVRGTVSRPDVSGKRPALLLIAGSGPTDRDWNSALLPEKNGSGKLLAHELSKRGLVVLRYDKLGSGATDAPSKTPITAEDAEGEPKAALELLRKREDVDENAVFVAGHSEGGIYAVRLAAADGAPKLAGLLLFAAAGRPMKDIVISQIVDGAKAQAKKANVDEKVVDEQMAPVKQDLDDFFGGKDLDPAKVEEYRAKLPVIAAIVSPASAPMVRTIYGYDPTTGIAKLGKTPIYIVNGKKDVQVSPTVDAQRLADAARGTGAPLAFFLAENADHVLKYQEAPLDKLLADLAAVQGGYNADGRVLDPTVLESIVSFLRVNAH